MCKQVDVSAVIASGVRYPNPVEWQRTQLVGFECPKPQFLFMQSYCVQDIIDYTPKGCKHAREPHYWLETMQACRFETREYALTFLQPIVHLACHRSQSIAIFILSFFHSMFTLLVFVMLRKGELRHSTQALRGNRIWQRSWVVVIDVSRTLD